MDITFESLPKKIQELAVKYRDRATKPNYRFLENMMIYAQYNRKDRDLKLTKDGLARCIQWSKEKGGPKMNVSGDVEGNQFRVQFEWSPHDKPIIRKEMKKHFGFPFNPSGLFLIPEDGGFFGWHTNADKTMPRVYIVWVEKPNSSWFYVSKDGKNIKTINEPQGWSVNCFQPPDWHAAKSNCIRFSMGFRQMKGEPVWLDQEK